MQARIGVATAGSNVGNLLGNVGNGFHLLTRDLPGIVVTRKVHSLYFKYSLIYQ